jgi:uncharacterized protein (DUF4415 family)
MKPKKSRQDLIQSSEQAWESRQLGSDEAYARRSEQSSESTDEALGLKMISIRLSTDLIDSYKLLGDKYGMGYQPLMREALKRFADSELKIVAKEFLEAKTKSRKQIKISDKKAA